jgi:hypothetical protein
MLNKAKVLDYFNAQELIGDSPIHIIGCGSVGSHIAELFARQGLDNIHLWDFDSVSAHNITNQMFIEADIKTFKVDAIERYMRAINPEIKLVKHAQGLQEPYILNGYIFLCVDNIELRKKIVLANQYNPNAVAFFDFRTRLTDAQHYAALRDNADQMKSFLSSMDFTHEEVLEHTPVSACGVEMNVVDVIKVITSLGFANFRNYLRGAGLKTLAIVDMESMLIDVV